MRLKKFFDYRLFATTILLVLIGILIIYSATYHSESSAIRRHYQKQLLWFGIGLGLMAVVVFLPLKFFFFSSYWAYPSCLGLLIYLAISGEVTGQVFRRISLGPIQFQPTEFAKIATILTLARYLSNRDPNNKKTMGVAFALGIFPMILVAKQPDLSSSLVFALLPFSLLFWGGTSPLLLFLVIAPFLSLLSAFNYYSFIGMMAFLALVLYLMRRGFKFCILNFLLNISVGVMTPFVWQGLPAYQKKRILAFLGIEADPQGAGYQIIQSKVALGSGGLWGKGYLQGTQTQLRFLPEQHTDFIFSVLGEEFGFLGSVFVLCLLLFLIWRSISIASLVKNRFASLVAIGITTVLLFHTFTNIGVATGIFPVTGLPLPFLSYGGSFLITCMIMVALLLNISIRRFQY